MNKTFLLQYLGQNYARNFMEELRTWKVASVIIWPLGLQFLVFLWQQWRLSSLIFFYLYDFTKLKLNYFSTAKWIWDIFIFSSPEPKYDKQLFVYFCVFTWIYLFCPVSVVLRVRGIRSISAPSSPLDGAFTIDS